MIMRNKRRGFGGLIAYLAAFATLATFMACGGNQAAKASDPESGGEAAAKASLRIGLMPAVDIAPILVAADRGYFAEAGIDLVYEIYASAQDRQSALQAGAIDGALTDLVALCANVAGGFGLKATTSTDGMFAIVARPGYSPSDTATIALMETSVTNFLADRWLGASVKLGKVYVNDIAARLEAVAEGKADLGVFPEPLASVAIGRGMSAVASSKPDESSPQAMAFTDAALRDKADAIRAFHAAYNRAVADIQANPALARAALAKAIPSLTPALAEKIRLPVYREASLPDDAYLRNVVDWTAAIMGKRLTLGAAELFDRRFTK